MDNIEDEFENLTKEQEKIDGMNIQKNIRRHKMNEMAAKVHKNEISKNILKGATEENERRQKIKKPTKK